MKSSKHKLQVTITSKTERKLLLQNKTFDNVNINGITIACETLGTNKESAVLLIAGAMSPMIFWNDEFCERLAADHFVIRFDNRDFGKSTHFPTQEIPPYTIHDMVQDAALILAHYGVQKLHIIGHSLGGSIAQLFAVKYPERILSLIPISSPILAYDSLPYTETDAEALEKTWQILMENHCYEDYERGKEDFLKSHQALHGDYLVNKEMSYEYTKYQYDTEPVIEPHLNHTNIQKNIPDIYQQLQSVQFPILFIHGTKDFISANPENVRILAASLPTASYAALHGAGHMFLNRELWLILYQTISDFLQTCEKQSEIKQL